MYPYAVRGGNSGVKPSQNGRMSMCRIPILMSFVEVFRLTFCNDIQLIRVQMFIAEAGLNCVSECPSRCPFNRRFIYLTKKSDYIGYKCGGAPS